MPAFRRLLMALSVAIPFVGLVHAQQPSGFACTAAVPVPPIMRAEGVTELIGDIVLTCTGGSSLYYTIGSQLPIANITVTLPVNVTSRLLNTGVTPNVSEALLVIDEPGSGLTPVFPGSGAQAPQTICSSASLGATTGGCPQYPVVVGNSTVMSSSPTAVTAPANIYQGTWNPVAPNQIQFLGVPILPAVNTAVARIYRITNIRANVSTLVSAVVNGRQALSASVSVSAATQFSVTQPVLVAGYVETSLSVATRNTANTGPLSPPDFIQCPNQASIIPTGILQYTEDFATAFKARVQPTAVANSGQQATYTQNIPGTIYNSESGFTIQSTPNGPAGLADFGTRLKATFHSIPSGVRMFVSIHNVTNSSVPAPANGPLAALVSAETDPDTGTLGPGVVAYPAVFATTTVNGIPAAEIVVDATGTAAAVWESVTNNPAAIDQYNFVVYVLYSGGSATGSATVNMSYAPIPPVGASVSQLAAWGTASATLPIPRFADLSTAMPIFSVGVGILPPICVEPSLAVTKTHSGNFALGDAGDNYTITVSNPYSVATSGAVIVVDTLPNGLTATAMSGSGWGCTLGTLTCTRSDSLVQASYPAITLTVRVAVNAPSQVTNQVAVSGGGFATSASASASDLTNIVPPRVTLYSPGQGSTAVPLTATLTWGAVAGASSYNVYFGTSTTPPLYTTTSATSLPVSLSPGVTYYWSVSAVNASSSTPSTTWSFSTGGQISGYAFVPITPCRVMDTRGGGTFGGPAIAGGATRIVSVPQSDCNIPSTAQAYSLNVTAVPSGPLIYMTVWPTGQAQPNVSTLNSLDGRIVANAAIVPTGTGPSGPGAISVYASNTTDAIIDINGYFVPASTSGSMSFYMVAPCRVVDTRTGPGTFAGPFLSGGSVRSFAIPLSSCGVSGSAQAYSLNITAVPHGGLGYLSIWPTGLAQPVVSTLNSADGSIVANAAIVAAGGPFSGPGAVSVYASNDTDLIIDINGYFAAPGSPGALSLYTLAPCRVADTRLAPGGDGGPSLAGNSTRTFPIASSACSVPSTAQAYALNITVVPPGPLQYLTAWAAGQAQPLVSTLNSYNGKIVANAAIVPAGLNGSINLFVSNTTDAVLDINAYFAQ